MIKYIDSFSEIARLVRKASVVHKGKGNQNTARLVHEKASFGGSKGRGNQNVKLRQARGGRVPRRGSWFFKRGVTEIKNIEVEERLLTSASFGGTRFIKIFVRALHRRKAWGGRWNMDSFIVLFAKDLW